MANSVNVGGIFATLELSTADFNKELKTSGEKIKDFAQKSKRAFKDLGTKISSSLRKINAPLIAFGRSISFVKRGIGKLLSVINPMRLAITGLAAGFALLKIANTAEAATQAAVAFKKLSQTLGTDAATALKTLRKALNGTVSDLGIMMQVSNAAILGVGDNIEDMARIFQTARRLGQATGRTAEEALGDIVVGIGRQSRLILDNLGLIVQVTKAKEAYARKINKTADELNDAEARQAFLNATLEAGEVAVKKLGDEVETFAVRFQQIKASISNFGVEVSVRLAPALTTFASALQSIGFKGIQDTIVIALTDALKSISEWMKENSGGITSFLDNTIKNLYIIAKTITQIAKSAGERFMNLLQNPAGFAQAIGTYLEGLIKVWMGVGKIVGAQILKFFGMNSDQIYTIFKNAGKFFLEALKPLGTLFDAVLDGIDVLIRDLPFIGETTRERKERLTKERNELLESGRGKLLRGDPLSISEGTTDMMEADKIQDQIDEINESLKQPGEQFAKGISEQLEESGTEDLKEAVSKLLEAVTGETLADVQALVTDVVTKLNEEIEKSSAIFEKQTVFGFSGLSDKDREEARKTLDPFFGLNPDEIATAFEEEKIESLTAGLDMANTLLSEQKMLADDSSKSFTEILEANRQIVVLQEQIANIAKAQSILLDKQAADDIKKEKVSKAIADAKKLESEAIERIRQLEDQNIIFSLEGEAKKKAIMESTLAVAARRLDSLNIEGEAREKILGLLTSELELKQALADADEKATKEAEDKAKAEAEAEAVEKAMEDRRSAIASGLSRSLVSAAEGAEDAFRNFTRGFVGDFENQLQKGIEQLGSSMTDVFGGALKDVFGSENFGALLGFISMLSSRRSSTQVTEIPAEDIVASTTNVRGVVAGPESVAISQIGSSIREANRGVESLLTEIRDTLQSIEGGGLSSGGLGSAGLV
jgi:Zn-dependent protease